MLGNQDIQAEAGVRLALPEEDMTRLEAAEAARGDIQTDERGIVIFGDNPSLLPLKVRIGIDLWAKNLTAAGMGNPHKVLNSVYSALHPKDMQLSEIPPRRQLSKERSIHDEAAPQIRETVVKTAAYVVNEFVTENQVEGQYGQIYDFAHFLLKGILRKIEESLENLELRASEDDRKFEE